MKIHGKYVFKQQDKIILEGNNLITLLGESFFMNRVVNQHFEPIKYIISSVDLINKKIILKATFEAGEVLGTCEIGVANDDILISHDIYEKMSSSFLEDSIGEVDVTYSFELTTGSIRKDFNKVADKDYTYWIAEPSLVVGVTEKDTNCGLRYVDSIDDVEDTVGSYYYSISTKNLYIHTTRSSNPNLENIIIETK